MLVDIIFAICIVLLGATSSKPVGWVVLGGGVLAMLLLLFGGHVHVG